MFGFKKNNYLKRTDFINSVDSNKIWSKSMTLSEIKDLLELLEKELCNYEFKIDKNFLMDGRRNTLKSMIEERLSKDNEHINENIIESLFNFWEFVNNEYYAISLESLDSLKLTQKEISIMCEEYTKSGIICSQERDIILEMIQIIKNYMIKYINYNGGIDMNN